MDQPVQRCESALADVISCHELVCFGDKISEPGSTMADVTQSDHDSPCIVQRCLRRVLWLMVVK